MFILGGKVITGKNVQTDRRYVRTNRRYGYVRVQSVPVHGANDIDRRLEI